MVVNPKMLTVEDANSIVEHFGKGFMDYYELDTRIFDESTILFSYDFIEVYSSTNSFRFTISNTLWTGGYFIRDTDGSDVTVTIEDNIILVEGTDLTYVVLVLELSPEFVYDDYVELEFNPVYTPVIRPFYEDIDLSMVFVDNDSSPISSLELTDNVTGQTITTDENGYITVSTGINKAGDYDYSLTGEHDSTSVDYNFPYHRIKVIFPVIILNETLVKDKKQEIHFQFLYDGDYNILSEMLFEDNNIILHCNNKDYTITSYDGNTFSFLVDLEDYTNDYITLKLNISGNDYMKNNSVSFYEHLSYFSCNTASVLKDEIEDDNGSDTIYYTGDTLDETINVNRDVSIIFSKEVLNTNDGAAFLVDDNAELVISGLVLSGTYGLAEVYSGSVVCSECNFSNMSNTILWGANDALISVQDSRFVDNTNCISCDGSVTVYNCEFSLTNTVMLGSDNVAFVKAINEFNVDYCDFTVDLENVEHLSFGYLFFFIGKTCTVNNINSSNLLVNESFPFKKSTSSVNIETDQVIFTGKFNKTVLWTVEDTNTLYSNELEVEYVQ